MRLLFPLFIVCFLLNGYAYAQNDTDNPQEKLSAYEQKIADVAKKKAALGTTQKAQEKKVKAARKTMIALARDIQTNEKTLYDLETEIDALQKTMIAQKDEIEQSQVFLSKTLTALQRLGRMPSQALILSDDPPLKTAQTALLLSRIVPSLQEKSKTLAAQVSAFEALSADLDAKKQTAIADTAALKDKQSAMKTLLAQREAARRDTAKDLKAQTQELKKMAKAASSLKALIASLNAAPPPRPRPATTKKAEQKTRAKPPIAPAPPSIGAPQLPMMGTIITAYNAKDKFGAPSNGIKIKGRAGALGVAPMGGVVKFSGSFKHYDNLIILEHKGGYHSLIAGLSRIDTHVGQSLNAGEPLGRLGTNNTTLYYELRRNGAAINPAKKIKI